ncbi:MAG: hypothetical protein ACFFDH_17395 [Promethearchaeota archaeon]
MEKVLLLAVGVIILSSFLIWIIPNLKEVDEYRKDNDNPIWDQTPKDQIIEYGEYFFYDVNASDVSGIDHYWINDTSNLYINNEGVIISKTRLNVGEYWLEIRAYDPSNNFIATKIKITVKID